MKLAMCSSLSLHAVALTGIYCLTPSGGGSFLHEKPLTIEFFLSEDTAPLKRSEGHVKAVTEPLRKKSLRSSLKPKISEKSSRDTGPVQDHCQGGCQPIFSPSSLNGAPDYPSTAREKGIEGHAVFRLFLDTKGNVVDVKLCLGTMHTLLCEAAIQKLLTWRFYGKMPPFVEVPISFNLIDN